MHFASPEKAALIIIHRRGGAWSGHQENAEIFHAKPAIEEFYVLCFIFQNEGLQKRSRVHDAYSTELF